VKRSLRENLVPIGFLALAFCVLRQTTSQPQRDGISAEERLSSCPEGFCGYDPYFCRANYFRPPQAMVEENQVKP
jgi:hypothetical protein